MNTSGRKPYRELQRKLVLAFDVGTTFSGASFAMLDPGRVPEIQGVTRFPGQQSVGGNSKIPSVICYNSNGSVRAVGEEAVQMQPEEMSDDEDDEDDDWNNVTVQRVAKVEWFKLHLRPKTLSASHVTDADLPPLPFGKKAVDVFGDFLHYLYTCTRTYVEESIPSGQSFWDAVETAENIEFVLTHPNGWEGAQQAQMRDAAIHAGLINDTPSSRARVHFVTEGEASLHFCINKGIVNEDVIPVGEGLVIIDAGGGTIDLSAYQRTAAGQSFAEIAQTACLIQGSVMVSRRAKSWLKENLQGSKYAEEINRMTEIFDSGAKLTFKNAADPAFIRFGGVRDKEPKFDIRSGQKKIPGSSVASFFEPSIQDTIVTVKKQRTEAKKPMKTALLVGGFAASDWMFSELQRQLSEIGISLARPDGHVNKAVADGAVSFYLDHFVSARVSKLSYGTRVYHMYIAQKESHRRRVHTLFTDITGYPSILGGFSEILAKGVQVSETREFRESFYKASYTREDLYHLNEIIECYRGDEKSPEWTDEEPHLFSTVCTVKGDLSKVVRRLPTFQSLTDGRAYYKLIYDIVLSFGLTEIQAQICWKDANGAEQRSPAEVIYDDSD